MRVSEEEETKKVEARSASVGRKAWQLGYGRCPCGDDRPHWSRLPIRHVPCPGTLFHHGRETHISQGLRAIQRRNQRTHRSAAGGQVVSSAMAKIQLLELSSAVLACGRVMRVGSLPGVDAQIRDCWADVHSLWGSVESLNGRVLSWTEKAFTGAVMRQADWSDWCQC